MAAYLAKIAQAKHDHAHVNASIRLLEVGEQEQAHYIVSHGFFKEAEIADNPIKQKPHPDIIPGCGFS